MSLPGLELSQPGEGRQHAPIPPAQINLSAGSEWRFEVAFGTAVRVKLLTGTAELFGTELASSQTYTFSGTKAAIYTWHGCTLEVTAGGESTETTFDGLSISPPSDGSRGTTTTTATTHGGRGGASAGGCQSEYTAEETPMIEYANVHFALETLRQEAKETGKDGPRVLIVGPENAGKTSLAKILTSYATKVDRQPIVVNLDPAEGMLSVPGTLTATTFRTVIDVEQGWGSSPMSGPSPVPVKLPLVYFYPSANPLEMDGAYYRPLVSRLALSVMGRMAEDEDTRETGIIVDTPGVLGQGRAGSVEMIHHIVTEFSISVILVIGSERLYSTMLKRYDNEPTSSASAVASDERISVIKLSKSGGCVDRDAAFMKAVREHQIRSYFFGNLIRTSPTAAASALALLSATSSSSITLSPHTQQLDFSTLAIYNTTMTGATDVADNDEDEYDPSRFLAATNDSFLPGGSNDADFAPHHHRESSTSSSIPGLSSNPAVTTTTSTSNSNTNGTTSTAILLTKLQPPAPSTLANTLLAITHAAPSASLREIRDASIMGFVYVADVDAEKGKIRVLAPIGGRVPPRAMIWGRKWPGEVVGLVG